MTQRLSPADAQYSTVLNAFNRNRPSPRSPLPQTAEALGARWMWTNEDDTLIFIQTSPASSVADPRYGSTSFHPTPAKATPEPKAKVKEKASVLLPPDPTKVPATDPQE